MSELPEGWAEATLGAVVEFKYGKSLPESAREPGIYKVYGSNGPVGTHNTSITDAPAIVVGRKGSIGEVHFSNSPCFPIDTTYFIDQFDACSPKFSQYLLKSLPLSEMNRATTIPGLNREDAYALPIRLPPPAEQKRIVAKLDTLTGATARARAELDRIPALIARYKQAILSAAFTGELTREWRREHGITGARIRNNLPKELDGLELPNSWTIFPISEITNNFDGRRVPIKASDRASRHGAYPYFGASGQIDTIDEYIFDGKFLLVGEDGANLIARSTPIAFKVSGRFWVNNHAHVLQATEIISNCWLCHFINWINLEPYVTGSAQPKLTQANLNRICVPVPSKEEQKLILAELGILFSMLDRMAAEHEKATRLLPRLDQEILAKAFRGELVPQDPNDEPASVLLERIRAQRLSDVTGKRGLGRRKRKTEEAA